MSQRSHLNASRHVVHLADASVEPLASHCNSDTALPPHLHDYVLGHHMLSSDTFFTPFTVITTAESNGVKQNAMNI